MMRYTGTARFAGFAFRGQSLAPASRPWITDLSMLCPYSELEPGNIPEFESSPDWDNWCLTDSPSVPEAQINWLAFESEGRKLYVADRMLLVRVSWQDLDERGFVFGAPVRLDGRNFQCRLLTGGHTPRENPFEGATTQNEWDDLLSGKPQDAPKPDPSDATQPLSPGHLSSPHNKVWNWFGAVSWTAEPFSGRENGRVCRGYNGPNYFYVNTVDHRHEDIGWRPVLEVV
jgi:hypothetical protein